MVIQPKSVDALFDCVRPRKLDPWIRQGQRFQPWIAKLPQKALAQSPSRLIIVELQNCSYFEYLKGGIRWPINCMP